MMPMPAPTPLAELMMTSIRPEVFRPVAKNSAQMINATIPVNILPILWNIAIASLKIFLMSLRRMISTMTTNTQTIKREAMVSNLMDETTSFEKTISKAIGKTGKMAYHFGTAGASTFLTSTTSAT